MNKKVLVYVACGIWGAYCPDMFPEHYLIAALLGAVVISAIGFKIIDLYE